VDAAIAYVDRHGNRAFTMRDIGNALGVEAMALYRHVNGREDLLEAVVSSVLHDVTGRLDDALTRTWQGYLQTLANAIRQIALDHPGVFPLVATRHPEAPWLRPPLRSLEVVQHFLETLSGFGFSDEQVVATYRSFSSFLLGSLLLEAAQRGARTSPIEEPLDEGDAEVPRHDPGADVNENAIIRRFRPLLSEDRSAEEFEVTLESLLDRLEMSVSQ
jgi:TetR/AcrR family tetracycline transcriptional repressor